MEAVTALLEWGVAALTVAGQVESGDRHIVKPFQSGTLVAVVDGLGHGADAAAAAEIAVASLERHAHESVIFLVGRCHERLHQSRGVVMSLASFSGLDATMTWLGVGNVEGVLLRADTSRNPRRETLLLRGGVVGAQLPSLSASIVPITPGDTLVFATDGIRSGFAEGLILGDPPQRNADRILARHGMGTDDALVLVARYVGSGP
jgi:phosphoserine phosphatase RsbX